MPRLRLSLAAKCQLMFGAAVVLLLIAALSVPWLRLEKLVEGSQRQVASKLAEAWLADLIQFGGAMQSPEPLGEGEEDRPLRLRLIDQDTMEVDAAADPFVADALDQFTARHGNLDTFRVERDDDGRWLYRYARAIRQRDLEPARGGFAPDLPPTQVADPLRGILMIEMRAEWAEAQVTINRIYLANAALLASVLAIVLFWFILTRIILSPVRVLRDTAEKVAEGDLNIRSDINTGDEFEQLSDTFNNMLTNLKSSQDKLRKLNKQLDLKLGELAQSNLSLYEANRMKGDFLANVSHELRTPLNSIIGFAEVLAETTPAAGDGNGAALEKRRRYIDNILSSSRSLLRMISDLLDLAKIEAGRIDLEVDRLSVRDAAEALLNLIRPQSDRKAVTLALHLARNLPIVRTDAGKFQQIIFNFLSNAVKFTPPGGRVELGAAPDTDRRTGRTLGLRVWVSDTGPGIPIEQQEAIFEKFKQLDSSHTKEHGGTGLGLAISTELARLLDGRIELDSDIGRGATFTLIIPLVLEGKSEPLMPNLTA